MDEHLYNILIKENHEDKKVIDDILKFDGAHEKNFVKICDIMQYPNSVLSILSILYIRHKFTRVELKEIIETSDLAIKYQLFLAWMYDSLFVNNQNDPEYDHYLCGYGNDIEKESLLVKLLFAYKTFNDEVINFIILNYKLLFLGDIVYYGPSNRHPKYDVNILFTNEIIDKFGDIYMYFLNKIYKYLMSNHLWDDYLPYELCKAINNNLINIDEFIVNGNLLLLVDTLKPILGDPRPKYFSDKLEIINPTFTKILNSDKLNIENFIECVYIYNSVLDNASIYVNLPLPHVGLQTMIKLLFKIIDKNNWYKKDKIISDLYDNYERLIHDKTDEEKQL